MTALLFPIGLSLLLGSVLLTGVRQKQMQKIGFIPLALAGLSAVLWLSPALLLR